MKKASRLSVSFVLLLLFALMAGPFSACGKEEPKEGPPQSAQSPAASSSNIQEVPVKGMVTMLDIGATECIPCKMMAPIMEELEKEYHGRAAIIFIDVWKNREQGPKFGIRAIPTQIFYDKSGKEVYRHEGFMDKAKIVAMLDKLGVK